MALTAAGIDNVRFEARLLLGMGLREFSMHPAQLLAIKQEILNADIDVIEPAVKRILKTYEAPAIADAVERLRLL